MTITTSHETTKNGMPTTASEPCVYLRSVRGAAGCMMGNVAIDCINVDAQQLADAIGKFFADMAADREDDVAGESVPTVHGQRVIVREADASDLGDWLVANVLCDENFASVYVVNALAAR